MLGCLEHSPQIATAPGTLIAIRTESMTDSDRCEGRAWEVVKEDAERIRGEFGVESPSPKYHVCEHMLELD